MKHRVTHVGFGGVFRLQAKLLGVTEPITRVTLFVPGTPASLRHWNEALRRGELRVENGQLRGNSLSKAVSVDWVSNDGEFGAAFSYGTVKPDIVRLVDTVPGALVLSWQIDLRDGRGEIVSTVEKLRAAGAIAVRLEQSKLGWDVSRWIELFSSQDAWAWHRGAVAFLMETDAMQSCGMHSFSLPDVRISLDCDERTRDTFVSALNVYQLAEDPVLRSGHTFSPDRETPRRVIERWPDTQYPTDHLCHNPYGVWRIGPPGNSGRPAAELVPAFVPTLYSLLGALEAENGKPLTRQQVEAVRNEGACIAMKPRDAQRLERERGYSDLNPELVWEQWQLVRKRV